MIPDTINNFLKGNKVGSFNIKTIIYADYDSSKDRWSVKMDVGQKRKELGSDEWEEKNISMYSTDSNLLNAIAQAVLSVNFFLESVNGNLFEDPSDISGDIQ